MLDFDKSFVKKIMQKDKSAFGNFYLKTVDYFFRYLLTRFPTLARSDIDDILAGFYMKIRNTKNYKEQQNFKAFVRTVLKNHTKDYFKKKTEISFGYIGDEETTFEETLVSDNDILQLMEQNFKKEKIQQAIAQLSEAESEVFFLKFVEQKENKEIQEILDISDAVVRKRLSRAVKTLKTLLKKK